MRPSTLIRSVVVLILAGVSAGTSLAQVVPPANPVTLAPRGDQLIEIKIRRARWNTSIETLGTTPATPAVQQVVKVAVAPAENDLVGKQLVSVSCAGTPVKSEELGSEGGVVTCTIDGNPADVKVTIAVEFVLSTGLPAVTKTLEKKSDGTGLLVLFQVFSDTTNLFLDRGLYACYGDYMYADLYETSKGKDQPQRQLLLNMVESKVVTNAALFNVLAKDDDPPLRLMVSGRLQGYPPARLVVLEGKAVRGTPSISPYWDPYRGHMILAPTP